MLRIQTAEHGICVRYAACLCDYISSIKKFQPQRTQRNAKRGTCVRFSENLNYSSGLHHFNYQTNVVSTGKIDIRSKNMTIPYHLKVDRAQNTILLLLRKSTLLHDVW